MKNIISITAVFSVLFAAGALRAQNSQAAQNEKIKIMEERLYELEQQQRAMERWYSEYYVQSQGRVAPFLGEKISFGGYLETAMTHLSGPQMPTQFTVNSNTLGLNIAAEFNEKVRFVSQFLTALGYSLQNAHNNPALTPSQRQYGTVVASSLVAQGYVEFVESEMLSTQIGVGYVPFGYAFQQREPVLFRRRGGPQLLSASGSTDVGIAFPLWTGIHIHGILPVMDIRTGYNLYTFSPSTKPRTMGVGGRLWWSLNENITTGISLQSGEQVAESYMSYGADVNVKWQRFGVTAEYAQNAIAGSKEDVVSYYLEPYYTFNEGKFLIYAVGDYVDAPNRMVGAVADPYEQWRYGLGVNWLPLPNTRLRLGVLNHEYVGATASIGGQERRYTSIEFSTGIAF